MEISPLPPSSPFRTVQSVVEVKHRCFSAVPVHFQAAVAGEQVASLVCRWGDNTLTATLQARAV